MRSAIAPASVLALLIGAVGAPALAQRLPPPQSEACAREPLSPRPCALPSLSEAEAKALLRRHDVFFIRRLEPVGDYWEAQATPPRGRHETVYVLSDGQVLRAPPLIGAP
ncbi:MAG TPA: hypothetical protein VE397_07730 [Stellaceae bacterium]|nr:hypothetical protein [Stellaceae bacterium]